MFEASAPQAVNSNEYCDHSIVVLCPMIFETAGEPFDQAHPEPAGLKAIEGLVGFPGWRVDDVEGNAIVLDRQTDSTWLRRNRYTHVEHFPVRGGLLVVEHDIGQQFFRA
jgi:hypothetical protein